MQAKKILKFGGSSVETPERIAAVAAIIQGTLSAHAAPLVVVSAFGKVTDELISLSLLASQGAAYQERLKLLEERHLTAANRLIPAQKLPGAKEWLNESFQELRDALKGIFLIKELSKRSRDLIMSFGERFCAYITAASIEGATYVDARELIKTDASFGAAQVDFEKTNKTIRAFFENSPNLLPIITGFIASTASGDTTTLGRGGSDYSAAIIGAALDVDAIEIWTDVSGVMTADPRKVKDAFSIPTMSYKEALEMSHFGAKVLHPPTIAPALKKNIPLVIKNSFAKEDAGTRIAHRVDNHLFPITGITSIDHVALLRVEGSGMLGASGTAMRVFEALAKLGISVILITQASSEHSICLAISPDYAESAKSAIDQAFALEQKADLMDPVIIETGFSILAVVGEGMRETPGIAGRLFNTLGKNGINIAAIAQGSSEYNISFAIRKDQETLALNAIHKEFFTS